MPLIDKGAGWSILKDENGIIHSRITGSSDDEEMGRYLDVWQRVIQENAPCLHLLDAGEFELNNLSKRWELAGRMKENRQFFRRSAVVGLDGGKRLVASIVIKASRRDNVKLFDTVEEAEAWLLS